MSILKAQGFLLRPWRAGDEESLAKYANNRKISINLRDRFPFPYTLKDAENWIQFASPGSISGALPSAPLTNFAIEVDSQAVGGVGFMLGSDVFRHSAELGYWLGEPYWGKGLMTEAVKLVTEYGFSELKLKRIYAGVFETNPASAKVLEKAGYTFESRMSKAVIKEGQYLDQLMYVMVR
jgi:RimJ/RimL family protein N-acetyltransferase